MSTRQRTAVSLLLGLSLAGALALGCSTDDFADGAALEGPDDSISPRQPSQEELCSQNPLLSGCDSNNGTPGGQEPELPPEVEREETFRAPVVTGRYVWSANPESGRVAVIDAETFEVRSALAGLQPTEVAALSPGNALARAAVINQGSRDATILALQSSGAIDTVSAPLHEGADRWSVGPNQRFAIAWTDARGRSELDPTDGFQDITVLDVPNEGAPVATRLTVGYRPSAVAFDASGSHAYAVTQDGISVIELGDEARLSELIPLPTSADGQPDVSVLPDGSGALARLPSQSQIHYVDFASRAGDRSLQLEGELTDLDISGDGSWAVAVIRQLELEGPSGSDPDAGAGSVVVDAGAAGAALADAGVSDAGLSDAGMPVTPQPTVAASAAVFIPLPEGLTDQSTWERVQSTTELFGSAVTSRDGSSTVLFTTLSGVTRVTLVNAERQIRSANLQARVAAVFLTPDSSHALALLDPPAGSERQGAFSVLPLSQVRAPKLVASDAPTHAVAIAGSSDRALVTVSSPSSGVFGSYLVRMPSLQVDFSELPSRPLSTGTVPSVAKAFVAQAHAEGRITFIDLATGDGRDITGFELSARVVE